MEHLKKLENRSYSTIQLLKSASMPAHPPLPPELLLLDRDRWLLVLARNFILLSNATGTHIFVFFLQQIGFTKKCIEYTLKEAYFPYFCVLVRVL